MLANLTLYKEARAKTQWYHDLLSAPFIYGMIAPLFILDFFLEIYHHIAFRLYHLRLLNRKEYIVFDRVFMEQLTFSQKINCIYCSYANGMLRYAVDIAAETEKYWCPLKYKDQKVVKHQPQQKVYIGDGNTE